MSTSLDGHEPPRRSSRLKNEKPAYSGLVGPERTPTGRSKSPKQTSKSPKRTSKSPKRTPKTSKLTLIQDPLGAKRGLNQRRKQEVKREEQKFYPHHTKNLHVNGTVDDTTDRLEHLETQNDVLKTYSKVRNEQAVENLSRSNVIAPVGIPGPKIQAPPSKSIFSILILIGVLVLLIGLYCSSDKVPEGENLKVLFPQQSDRLWGFVSHGLDSTNPFVLLLVHNGQAELANCLGRHIAETVVRRRTKQTTDPIILDGKNVNSNLLLTLKSQMEKQHALVLQNVEFLHANMADKLHFILDTYEPWIPGGVYVLTLNVPDVSDDVRETFSSTRAFLKNKWSGYIKDDDLEPLIARICNFEYVLKKDSNPCKRNF